MSDSHPPLIARRDCDLIDLELSGLKDENCAVRAQEVLESLPGVYSASVDFEGARASIRLADTEISTQTLIDVLAASGFPAQVPQPFIDAEENTAWTRFKDWWSEARLPWRRKRFWPRLAAVVGLTILVLPPLWVAIYGLLPVPVTPLMIERWLSGAAMTRDWSSFEEISPNLINAVIAGEDSKFCGHDGFDWEAIDSAMASNGRNNITRGASTISMQTAKNAFLWPARTWLRKGVEAYFTLLVETLWSKQRIMTVYLNIAEWGDGIYGAEAAARFYFKKSASSLTEREASLLAAILPNPREWHANPPGPYVQSRSATLLGRMQSVKAQGLSACVRN
jgi:monofunctional glycosyltransferase